MFVLAAIRKHVVFLLPDKLKRHHKLMSSVSDTGCMPRDAGEHLDPSGALLEERATLKRRSDLGSNPRVPTLSAVGFR
jgi:hypothetical protein